MYNLSGIMKWNENQLYNMDYLTVANYTLKSTEKLPNYDKQYVEKEVFKSKGKKKPCVIIYKIIFS